jgi:hypothetical protein
MRFITLPTSETTVMTVDVARIAAVGQIQKLLVDEQNNPIQKDHRNQYVLDESKCFISIDGYLEPDGDDSTSAPLINLSHAKVMACVYGFDNSLNYPHEVDA